MEYQKQHTADLFWQTYFSDLLDVPLTEQQAQDINFWDELQRALDVSEIETIKAVILSKPAVKITTGEMYKRIVRIAKHVWDSKLD